MFYFLIVKATYRNLLVIDRLVIEGPGLCWWWLTANRHIEDHVLADLDGYGLHFLAINPWFH